MASTIRTGIRGLDFVFNGGFQVPEHGTPPSIIISGPPGSGKSVLALAMACKAVRPGPDSRSVLYVSREEEPIDFRRLADRLSLLPANAAVSLDNNFRDLFLSDSDGPEVVFSYYPETAIRSGHPHNVGGARNGTLSRHIDDRVRTMRSQCGMIVIDSLYAGSFATPVSDAERTSFKDLCELSSENNCLLIVVVENEGNGVRDWREFVTDIVIQTRVELASNGVLKRYILPLKSRYQGSLGGLHTLELTDSGPEVYPNSTLLLKRLGERENDKLTKVQRPNAEAASLRNVRFAQFEEDLPAGCFMAAGVQPGSAILIYGDDQTRKRTTAVKFLKMASEEEAGAGLVICLGTYESSYQTVLREYWGTNRHPNESPSDGVKVIESPIDEVDINAFVSRLYYMLHAGIERDRDRSPLPFKRVVIDDLAAIENWADYVTPLRTLFRLHGVTSLFVHTHETGKEEHHRVMFDTIIKTKRLVRKEEGFTKHEIGYFKTKENSVMPKDASWWLFQFQNHSASLAKLDGYDVSSEGVITLQNSARIDQIPRS